MPDFPFPVTGYFVDDVLFKRSYLRAEWIQVVLDKPARVEVQPDGRRRLWGFCPALGKYLRVVTLDDGRTVHNAFPDRSFKP